jgi:beta-galactosidase
MVQRAKSNPAVNNNPTRSQLRTLGMSALSALLLCLAAVQTIHAEDAAEATAARRIISLDGTWQLAEGTAGQRPAQFDRQVPVPGLVDLSMPAFDPQRFADRKANSGPASDGALKDSAFWYRREFTLEGDVPAVASLLVRKAAYGSTVYLNGTKVGESQASFTASHYDVRAWLLGRGAANELVIRVGAGRDSLPRTVPRGQDYEKTRYIPGLFDSVDLELSGTPHFVEVQAAPDITNQRVRVQARVLNSGPDRVGTLKFVVREAKSGKVVGQVETVAESLAGGAEKTVDVSIPITDCRLWSPEDPFLYSLEASTGADSFETRFGMRQFRFETRQGDRPGCAILNGKPYFMRGSNVTLYRFFEDPDRGALPWNESWVRLLHRRFKEMHWNSLRYCIGLAPEAWYRIADEEGFLIQDEFPIWGDETGRLDSAILAGQYADWMRQRWNHPCVVIWDAQNETHTEKTGAAYSQVRALDLSNRPWDNGYAPTLVETDVSEAHPYHFGDPSMTLSRAVSDPVGMPNFNGAPNPGDRHAYIINEYGWLWLNRDGTPTTLTKKLYANLAGNDAPPSKLFPLAARLLAAETEFWRCRRQAAGVLHFCALGYSRPDGQTSDHWLDVKQLVWEPQFYRYVRDAFAPVGLMIDACAEEYAAGKPQDFPVVVINDLYENWKGDLRFRLLRDGVNLQEKSRLCEVPALGDVRFAFTLDIPANSGNYQLEAELIKPGAAPVRSLRDFSIMTDAERQARFGIAVGKPVKTSSNLKQAGATSPDAAVDGRPNTRWSSEFSDPQWIAVDLGRSEQVSRVVLDWEAAFGEAYAIEVSPDGQTWKQVYRTENGHGGSEPIAFPPVAARWIRMSGTKRGTPFGYSLWEFRVFREPGSETKQR